MGIFKKKESRSEPEKRDLSDADFGDLFPDQPDEARQRKIDLRRAQSRTVARPIKKELRHSKMEGAHSRVDEVRRAKKQLEEEKKAAAAKKKGGIFGRLFAKKDRKQENAGEQPEEERIKRNGITADQIKKLRGISGVSFDDIEDEPEKETRDPRGGGAQERAKPEKGAPAPADDGQQGVRIRGQSFMESVKRLSGETDAADSGGPQFSGTNTLPQAGLYPAQEAYPQEGYPYSQPYPESYYSPQGYAPYQTAGGEYQPYPPQVYESAYPSSGQPYPYRESEDAFPGAGPHDEKPYPPGAAGKDSPFAVTDDSLPDETIATALSVAVGFIYWDEESRLVDRIITIRRLIRHRGDIIIDAFCHDIAVPRMIPFSRGVRLYDIQTLSPYDEPREFLLHRIAGIGADGKYRNSRLADVLSVVRYDLAALAFAAKADFEKSDAENRLILKYISQRCPTIGFDEREMLDYISMLVPDEQSFYESVGVIVKQSKHTTVLFAQTFLKLILSDGFIHENERELLAELLYILRLEGIDLNMLGLK